MKISKFYTLTMGTCLSMMAVSTYASGFSPMAADRYTGTGYESSESVASQSATAVVGNKQGGGFRPFAANRYTSPTEVAQRNDTAASAVVAGNDAGAGFAPFRADRYSAQSPTAKTADNSATRVTRPSVEE